jgi:hypothetical protein
VVAADLLETPSYQSAAALATANQLGRRLDLNQELGLGLVDREHPNPGRPSIALAAPLASGSSGAPSSSQPSQPQG